MVIGQIDQLIEALSGAYDEGRPEARMTRAALRTAREVGLFTLTVPPDPCPLPEVMRILNRVGSVEPGVAWSAVNSIVFGHATARLGAEARSALLSRIESGPFAFSGVPGGRASASDTGLLLNGYWPFITGVEDCEMAVLAGLVKGGDRPDVRFFIVDPSDIETGTNWQNVAGLRTSGSHSGRVSDLLVLDDLAVRFDHPSLVDNPLYRLPVIPYFFGGAVAIFLGIFRSGVENSINLIAGKTSSMDGARVADYPSTQVAVAEAEGALRNCEAAFDALVEQLWHEVQSNDEVTAELRGACYRSFLHIIDTGRTVISRLYAASSTLAWDSQSRIHQALTDMHAIAITFERTRKLQMDGARQLFGLSPTDPTF